MTHAEDVMTIGPPVERDDQRVSRFVREAWLRHRLVHGLFAVGGRVRTGEPDVRGNFGFAKEVPAELLSRPSNDHLWRDLGRDFARGEVRELLDRLAAGCEVRPPAGPLRREVSRILDELRPVPGEAAILAPVRTGLLQELDLSGRPGSPDDPRSLGSPWYRGMFEDARVFAVPLTPARPLWVIDFGEIGEWRSLGDVDDLEVVIEPLRERLVNYGGTQVPGAVIRAVEYVEMELTNTRAARGLSV